MLSTTTTKSRDDNPGPLSVSDNWLKLNAGGPFKWASESLNQMYIRCWPGQLPLVPVAAEHLKCGQYEELNFLLYFILTNFHSILDA